MDQKIELLKLTQSAETRRHESMNKLQNFFILITTGFVIINIQMLGLNIHPYFIKLSIFPSFVISAVNIVLIVINILIEINYYDKISENLSKLMAEEVEYKLELFIDEKMKYSGWINHTIMFLVVIQILLAIQMVSSIF